MKKLFNTLILTSLSVLILASFIVSTVLDARERGGGGRGGGRQNVTVDNSRRDVRTNNVRSTSVNNVNVNRSTNVNVDVDRRGWNYDYHPVATAAAVTATAVVTSAVVGSIVHSLPPSCSAVVVNGITYQQCGSTWYQPQYAGNQVQYVVVAPVR
jgi:hypothetical protein